ncbi:MAG TPA: caspase family protein, partial [Chitinophagaceae bacterium]
DSADALKPDKQTIRRVLDSIGKKAAADDILMIYLSGHGVLYESDEKKQFYYLTADASSLTDEKAFPVVGISTDTLMEWIKLENIPANKRILVLDACYSGQVINDLKKDIDRLKENSKLFILSASASNKLSFESNEYEHGYLSYALLKVIKKQPDILLGTKLNISRWFNAAAAEVKDIARKENSDQTPHILTVVDFNIGTVDSSVIQNIRLVKESSLFVASNFQNADKIGDDLGFGMLVNEALRQINTGPERKIEYADVSAFTDAYCIIGRYTVRGNDVEVNFIITKGKETIKEFDSPVRGTKDKLRELAAGIAEKAAEWVNNNK